MSDNTFRSRAVKVWGSMGIYYRTKKAIWHLRRTKTRDWFKKMWASEDRKAVSTGAFTIFMDGILISGLCYPFIGFHWPLVFAFGAGWFFLKKDALVQLRKLLSSINIIKLGK